MNLAYEKAASVGIVLKNELVENFIRNFIDLQKNGYLLKEIKSYESLS
jgi:hypothetical protein